MMDVERWRLRLSCALALPSLSVVRTEGAPHEGTLDSRAHPHSRESSSSLLSIRVAGDAPKVRRCQRGALRRGWRFYNPYLVFRFTNRSLSRPELRTVHLGTLPKCVMFLILSLSLLPEQNHSTIHANFSLPRDHADRRPGCTDRMVERMSIGAFAETIGEPQIVRGLSPTSAVCRVLHARGLF